MDEQLIKKAIEQYKKKKANEYYNYHNKYKLDSNFMQKNKERANKHYHENKNKSKQRYEDNKDFIKARSSYNYYKRNDKLETFKSKFPERVKILKEHANLSGLVVVGLDY
jgi:guanylate kinase